MTRYKFVLFALILIGVGFTACKSDVDFTAQDQTKRYGITISPVPNPEHGVLSLSTNLAMSGERVKVYVNPAPGYKVQDDSVKYRNPKATNPAWKTISKISYYYQLEMAAMNAEVTAIFERLPAGDNRYTVSVDQKLKNGKIISDVTLGYQGDTVTLYDNPNSGYMLKEGSLTVLDAESKVKLASVIISDTPPYKFSLPAQNVLITAEFETGNLSRLLANARNYLEAGQYDVAAEFFAQAYKKRDNSTPIDDLNEVRFYYSFAKLGEILLSPTVRSLLGTGSLQMKTVPATLDDWICDMYYSGWQGSEGDKWYMKWGGLDYGDDNVDKGYTVEEPNAVLWSPRPNLVTEDRVLPKLEERNGIGVANNSSTLGGTGGWGASFPDMPLINQNPSSSPQKFANMLFWLLLITNREAGFNDLLEKIEIRLFGTAFEDAAKIAGEVTDGYQNVPLYANLVNRFELGKYYGIANPAYDPDEDPGPDNLPFTVGDDLTVGKAELDYIFGTLRMVKAAVQFLRAYNWSIYLQPYLGERITPGDGLDQILNHIFSVAEGSDRYRGYWETPGTRQKTLPFLNNLLNTHTAGNLSKAKSELSKALTMIDKSMTYWQGSSTNFSDQGKADYQWAKNAFAQAKAAVDGNGNFYFPKKVPKPGGTWPASNSADYAVNVSEFFKAGAFNLSNLFTIETGRRSPVMFKIPWYMKNINPETGAYEFDILPLQAERVTGPIPTEDWFQVPGQPDPTYFGLYSFEIKTVNLRKIFPHGFEQSNYSTPGDTAYHYEVFKTIPLWPERPTYLTGPGNTSSGTSNRSAQKLYQYFH